MEYRIVVEQILDDGSATARIVNLPVGAEQVAEIVADLLASALGVEPTYSAPATDGAPRQQRKRRTKAEIAADKAREDAGLATGGVVTGVAPVGAQEGPPEVVVPAPMNQTPGFDSAPAAPFNPFESKA